MTYEPTSFQLPLLIDQIVTIRHFECGAHYSYPCASPDFWELVYVDRGQVMVSALDRSFILEKDHILFHKPNEGHNVRSIGATTNLIVVAFVTSGEAMSFFRDRIIKIDADIKRYLQRIVSEAHKAFASDLSDLMPNKPVRRKRPVFGAEQMLKCFLEQLLIELYRRHYNGINEQEQPILMKLAPNYLQNENNEVFGLIVDYLEQNIAKQLKLNDICRDNLIARTALQKLFQDITGGGPIAFFNLMKIEHAKRMIRRRNLNFTQIAQKLGYSSIHYLSRQFHQLTSMTLSDYAQSIL